MICQDLDEININAHLQTFHPSALTWPEKFDQNEMDFYPKLHLMRKGMNRRLLLILHIA